MQQLRRELNLSHAMMTVIGVVIGSGIYVLPAVVFAQAQAPGLGILAWVIGGLISLAAGLTVAELGAAMPNAGGTYTYLSAAYGEWMGFLQGWAAFVASNSAMAAASAMIFTTYLTTLVPLTATGRLVVGIGLILLLTFVNAVGVRFGGTVQVVTALCKLVPVLLVILFGLPSVSMGDLLPIFPESIPLGTAVAGAVLPVLFAYDGWIVVGQLAEELKNPQRNLPLALGIGILSVTVIYALFNVALVGVLPAATLAANEKPVVLVADLLFGAAGSRLITIGMLISMLGTLNGMILTAPRYYFAMARDKMFPAAHHVGRLHPRSQTPVVSLVISALWSIVLLLSGRFELLLSLVVFVGWIFYVLTMIAVFVLRHTQPDLPRPYRVWGYPFVPLLGVLAGIWILWNSLVTDPDSALLGLGLAATGLPVLWYLRRHPAPVAAPVSGD